VEDWHVIVVAWIDGGDSSFTHQYAENSLNRITTTFTLDGAVLSSTHTAIKRFLDPGEGLEAAYFFQEGRIMSPDELTVGEHQLAYAAFEDGQLFDQDSITFFIDAANTGTCQA
jgi:hypothetical protein